MDPALSPFIERAVTEGPVTKFEVREKRRGGRESTVRRLDAASKSPEDLSEEIWEIIQEDYAGHLGEHYYAVLYYRPEQTEPEERKSFWLKGDHSSTSSDPESRHLERLEASLTAREAHIRESQQHMLDSHHQTVAVQQAIILDLTRKIEAKEAREIQTIELLAELADKKLARQLEMRREERKDLIVDKIQTYGMQLFAEMTKGKDGDLAPSVQKEMIQSFVDSLNDAQLDQIVKPLRDDQKGALFTVLRPFIERTIEKQRAQVPQQVPPTEVVGVETNGVASQPPPSASEKPS